MQLKKSTKLWSIALLALFQLVLNVNRVHAQVVTIPAANTNFTSSLNKTLGSSSGYIRTAEIYNALEIGKVGAINAIGFYYNYNAAAKASPVVPVKIYMKHTLVASASIAANGSVANEILGATLVFDGNLYDYQIANGGWTTIQLQNVFRYDSTGGNNLEVIVFSNYGNTGDGLPDGLIRCSQTGNSKTTSANNIPPATFGSSSSARDNIQLTFGTASANYTTSDVSTYPVLTVGKGKINSPVVKIDIEITGDSLPYSTLTTLNIASTGTTSLTDVSNLKVFYTGNNNNFYTSNQFGSTLASIGATQAVGGSQVLVPGHNYFWITYDVSSTATSNNTIDAVVSNITINSTTLTPLVTNPAGNRMIQGPLTGTVAVGATGAYTTIKAAAIDLAERGVSGPLIVELQSTYNPTLETFPIQFNPVAGTSTTNKVIIRPQTGAGPFTISGADSFILDLKGCSYIAIDGRAGGVGSTSNLTFENTALLGSTIRYFNEASNNTLSYVTVKSVCTSATGGNIVFGNTYGPQGNDNNTIEWCNLTAGATTPSYLIYAAGNIATPAQSNSGNNITNCKLYDHWHATLESSAIKIVNGNSAWSILNNSFYQTATRASTFAGINYGVYISSATGSGFVISGNYIGGSQELCGGTPYTITSTANHRFSGITIVSIGGVPASVVNNNTIANFNLSTASNAGMPGAWNGVNANGVPTIVNITNNTIGSMNSLGSVTVTNGTTGGVVTGIVAFSFGPSDTANITNNTIGGINVSGTGTAVSTSLYGMYIAGTATEFIKIEGNTVGSILPHNFISSSSASTATALQLVYGINCLAGSSTAGVNINIQVRNNTLQNISNYYAGAVTTATLGTGGIHISGTATYSVIGNTVKNIYSRSLGATPYTSAFGNAATATIAGIRIVTGLPDIIVKGNNVSNIMQDNVGNTAVRIAGILAGFAANPTAVNLEISNNIVSGLTTNVSNANASIVGISLLGGEGNVFNNVIRLGLDTSGNSLQQGYQLIGMYQAVTLGSGSPVPVYKSAFSFYHNTVYVGGDNVVSVNATYALMDTSSAISPVNIRDNVFMNTRSNISGTAKNYAIRMSNTIFTSNNNLLFTNSGSFGRVGTIDYNSLADWRTGLGQDGSSGFATPNFVNANGSTAAMNLHPQSPTSVEKSGVAVSTVLNDMDGKVRSGFSATDIGAYAGNFTLIDSVPPVITHVAVSNTSSTGNRTLTATITDATGLNTTTGIVPQLHYKKNAAGVYIQAAGTFVSGTRGNGLWSFTINASTLGTLAVGDSVYYFFAFRDSSVAFNLTSFPAGAIATDPLNVTSDPIAKFGYKINTGFAGVYSVGIGETYTSLTNAGGLFEALNAGVISGNITVKIKSDITETGTNALNLLVEDGSGNFKVTIIPDTAGSIAKVISGNSTIGLIRLDGARKITIDGAGGGNTSLLSIRNENTIAPTVIFVNDAVRDTIKNCTIEGANSTTTSGVILFSNGLINGNDSNVIINNKIRDLSNMVGLPANLIYSLSAGGVATNSSNNIKSNSMFNFTAYGVNVIAGTNSNGDLWDVSNNHVYQTSARTAQMVGIAVQSGNGHIISNNSIGGSMIGRGGAAMQNTAGIIMGINASSGTAAMPIQVINNTISNIAATALSGSAVMGINVSAGYVTVTNNIIGGGALASDTIKSGFDNGGININGGTAVIENNLVGNIRCSVAGGRTAGIAVNGGAASIVRNNIIRDIAGFANATTGASIPTGIYLANSTNTLVEQNTISNISNINPSAVASLAAGIAIASGTTNTISRNRISAIWTIGAGTGVNAPMVAGINNAASTAGHVFMNNQISMGAGTLDNSKVCGMVHTNGNASSYLNNSVFINGASTIGTINNSYGFLSTNAGALVTVKNNLLYNKRANAAYGFGSVGNTGSTYSNNLLVVSNIDTIADVAATTYNVSALNNLYLSQNSNNQNWMETVANLRADSLFIDTLVGNLGIVIGRTQSWYVNGKGTPNSAVTNDYNNAARSTTFATGSSDIGSVEFTTTTLPPTAVESAAPALNTTTTYSFANRTIAAVNWGAIGTVPTAVTVKYYSGVNAPSVVAGKTYFNAYSTIAATGGTGYSFSMSLIADDATIGTVASMSNAKIARLASASWNVFAGNNTAAGLLTSGSTTNAFGIFTGTDINNPLPVKLIQLLAIKEGHSAKILWATASELNAESFEIERSVNGEDFEYATRVKAAGNSNSTVKYSTVDKDVFEKLNAKTIFYRLKMGDNDGKFEYSDIVSVSDDTKKETVSVYPNPAQANITIGAGAGANYTIYSIAGKAVLTGNLENDQTVNVEVLQSGVYFIKVTNRETTQTLKFVKE